MRRAYLLLPGTVFFIAAFAQNSTPASTPMPPLPQDPAALMRLASQVDGLHSPNLKPWHLHATFMILDEKKDSKDQGTWEEWWAGEKEYKIHYVSSEFDQTRYVTHDGWFAVGDGGEPPPGVFAMIADAFLGPLPDPSAITAIKLKRKVSGRESPGTLCVVRDPTPRPPSPVDGMFSFMQRYCFAGDVPAIRGIESDGVQILLNSIVRFQDQYLARNVRIALGGGVTIDAELDKIETWQPAASDFAVPADALRVAPMVAVAGSVMAGDKISGAEPQYPDAAQTAHIQGVVALDVVVGRSGSVQHASVISGDLLFRNAAVDAVRTWRFRPWLVNGEPVEVHTLINVPFTLGQSAIGLW